jgi:hypothetical protein
MTEEIKTQSELWLKLEELQMESRELALDCVNSLRDPKERENMRRVLDTLVRIHDRVCEEIWSIKLR